MTETQVIDWMTKHLSEGTKPEQTALGMIMADVNEHGFDGWLNIPAVKVVEWYIETTEEVASELVNDFRVMRAQEKELSDMGISQSYTLDPDSSMEAFKDGVIDIITSLHIYLVTQELAKAYYGEHTH
tara:strand:- start:39 stop:422 length:384 start_codon:yes stop_codon:yes gene_type:complete